MADTLTYMTERALPAYIAELLQIPADKLTRDQLFELAADAAVRDTWDLIGHSAHVGRVCSLLGEWDVKLRATQRQLEACLQECVRLQEHAAKLSAENRELRHALSMWAVQVAVGGAVVHSDVPDKEVVDVDGLDGPSVDRTPTVREMAPLSAEIAAQYGDK